MNVRYTLYSLMGAALIAISSTSIWAMIPTNAVKSTQDFIDKLNKTTSFQNARQTFLEAHQWLNNYETTMNSKFPLLIDAIKFAYATHIMKDQLTFDCTEFTFNPTGKPTSQTKQVELSGSKAIVEFAKLSSQTTHFRDHYEYLSFEDLGKSLIGIINQKEMLDRFYNALAVPGQNIFMLIIQAANNESKEIVKMYEEAKKEEGKETETTQSSSPQTPPSTPSTTIQESESASLNINEPQEKEKNDPILINDLKDLEKSALQAQEKIKLLDKTLNQDKSLATTIARELVNKIRALISATFSQKIIQGDVSYSEKLTESTDTEKANLLKERLFKSNTIQMPFMNAMNAAENACKALKEFLGITNLMDIK
jgi:hypothetical protein